MSISTPIGFPTQTIAGFSCPLPCQTHSSVKLKNLYELYTRACNQLNSSKSSGRRFNFKKEVVKLEEAIQQEHERIVKQQPAPQAASSSLSNSQIEQNRVDAHTSEDNLTPSDNQESNPPSNHSTNSTNAHSQNTNNTSLATSTSSDLTPTQVQSSSTPIMPANKKEECSCSLLSKIVKRYVPRSQSILKACVVFGLILGGFISVILMYRYWTGSPTPFDPSGLTNAISRIAAISKKVNAITEKGSNAVSSTAQAISGTASKAVNAITESSAKIAEKAAPVIRSIFDRAVSKAKDMVNDWSSGFKSGAKHMYRDNKSYIKHELKHGHTLYQLMEEDKIPGRVYNYMLANNKLAKLGFSNDKLGTPAVKYLSPN